MGRESKQCIILILGFNRPEFVEKRVKELGFVPPLPVHISIDGGINSEAQKRYLDLENALDSNHFTVKYMNSNLGLVKHVTGTITKILRNYNYVIVIEDDVQISANFISEIAKKLKENENHQIASWGGFSPINAIKKFEKLNCWRETYYFSPWGWGISREHWSYYTTKIDMDLIDHELRNSKSWSRLSAFQKKVWKSRFRKVSINPNLTWDYQMQYMTFKHDFIHKLPVMRLTDNQGFNDTRSTNTRSQRPRWMGKGGLGMPPITMKTAWKVINLIMVFVDSLTISGDSKLLKSKLRNIFSKFRLRRESADRDDYT